jgi:hypothetical protein
MPYFIQWLIYILASYTVASKACGQNLCTSKTIKKSKAGLNELRKKYSVPFNTLAFIIRGTNQMKLFVNFKEILRFY